MAYCQENCDYFITSPTYITLQYNISIGDNRGYVKKNNIQLYENAS